MSAIYPYGSVPYGSAPIGTAPTVTQSNERFLILSPRESDAATLVASSQETALPVANLQSLQPKKVFRAGGSYVAVTVAFAEPVAANMLALARHNLGAGGVIRCSAAGKFTCTMSAAAADTNYRVHMTVGSTSLNQYGGEDRTTGSRTSTVFYVYSGTDNGGSTDPTSFSVDVYA